MIGKTISHYKILEKHGEGGMGVVYKAEDTKLHRTVALKFLPPELTRDEDAKQRFIQEAQAASSLDHNNICVIHEIGETENEQLFICMTYYDGETLKQKMEKGPLKLEEAIEIAIQMSQGLLKAHEQKITHRDIKPANIFITHDGVVKILDFGLAKLSGQTKMTKAGSTLGTIAYMSPEQARGEEVNHRTDIWSLGVVLYEMIIGRLPFKGEYEQAILYSIMTDEPVPMTSLRSGVPLELERIVAKALAKKREERYQHLDDMLVDLRVLKSNLSSITRSSQELRPVPTLPTVKPRKQLMPWFLTLFMFLVAIAAIWKPWSGPAVINQRPVHFSVTLQEGDSLNGISGSLTSVAISRDGRKLVYGVIRNGISHLYVRALESLQARPISGTEGARDPFFSPDGEWIGFFAGGYLKKVSLLSGAPQTICKASGRGGAWWPDNTIAFQRWSSFGGLYTVQADGSKLQQLATFDVPWGDWHSWPEFLPGSKAVLFTILGGGEESKIAIMSLESGKIQYLVNGGERARYSSTGHIIYCRPSEGDVWAAPFDINNLKITEPPFPVLEGVRQFALSETGTLAFIPGRAIVPNDTVALVNRKGEIRPLSIPPGAFHGFRFSPDGKRLVFSWHQNRINVWIYDLDRNVLRRFTEEQGNDWTPFWTPDGKRILFQSIRAGQGYRVFLKTVDVEGPLDLLTESYYSLQPGCWTADGKTLIVQAIVLPETLHDIMLLPLEGDRTPRPLIRTQYSERSPVLSPDGHWIAYASDESDRWEVYVRRYPDLKDITRISTEGGLAPMWSPDGRELFYWDTSRNSLVSVSVRTRGALEIGIPKLFAAGDFAFGNNAWYRSYDIAPDGKTLVMILKGKSGPGQKQFNVVLNWFEELKARERGGQ